MRVLIRFGTYGPWCSKVQSATAMTCKLFFRALLTLVVATPLVAHDTWLAPDSSRRNAPGVVSLSLSSGMEFPKLDHSIAPDRVAAAWWQSADDRGDLPSGKPGAHALEWHIDATEGVTQFSVVLHPRPSKLKPEQVREYIDHLGIPSSAAVFADWERTSKGAETSYRYMKYSKTFVRAGAAGALPIWAREAGMRLELVPQNDPTSLVSGATLEVLLVQKGEPLPRYPVALLREGAKAPSVAMTDTEGRVRLALPAAGHYMLRATTLEPSEDTTALWDVRFTTMTFEIPGTR